MQYVLKHKITATAEVLGACWRARTSMFKASG